MGPFMNALYRRQGNSRSECVWTAVAVCTLARRFLCLSSHCVPVANIFLVMLFRFCRFLLHRSRYLVIQVNRMRRVNLLKKNKLNTQRQLCQCEKIKQKLKSYLYLSKISWNDFHFSYLDAGGKNEIILLIWNDLQHVGFKAAWYVLHYSVRMLFNRRAPEVATTSATLFY